MGSQNAFRFVPPSLPIFPVLSCRSAAINRNLRVDAADAIEVAGDAPPVVAEPLRVGDDVADLDEDVHSAYAAGVQPFGFGRDERGHHVARPAGKNEPYTVAEGFGVCSRIAGKLGKLGLKCGHGTLRDLADFATRRVAGQIRARRSLAPCR